MKAEEDPDFQPGFRFSRFDAAILLCGSLLAIGVATWQPLAAAVVVFVLGHFFLFCNVFRIARVPELIWAAGFFLAATLAMLSDHPLRSWSLAFGVGAGLALVLIAWETRQPRYHGIGWQRFNPGLKDWWNRVRSPES